MDELESELRHCLSAIAAHDLVSFRRLYDLALPRLRSVSAIVLRNGSDCDDVLQATYVKIWQRAAEYRPASGSAMGWMMRICRNSAIDALRRERARGLREAHAIALQNITGVDGAETDLYQSLEDLPRDQALALAAIYVEGLTHEEFAERADLPLGTVNSRVRRGLRALKHLLQEDGS